MYAWRKVQAIFIVFSYPIIMLLLLCVISVSTFCYLLESTIIFERKENMQGVQSCFIPSFKQITNDGLSFCFSNRPLPSSKNPHFQNEARCTTFLVKMSFICMRTKNHFHIKDWGLNLVLIQRPGGTRQWPIVIHLGMYHGIWKSS